MLDYLTTSFSRT